MNPPMLRKISGFLPHLWRHLAAMWICMLSDGMSTLGLHRAGEALIRASRRRFPDEDQLPLQLSTIHERAGRLDDAVACLTELVRNGAEPPYYHFELATLHERHRQYELALVHFEQSLALGTRFGPEFRDFIRAKIEKTKRTLSETAAVSER